MKPIFYTLLLLFAIGCQDVKYPDPPANLIPHDKMIDVLTDAYINNAARSFNAKQLREKGYKLDSVFYAKFTIDSLQFVESNLYYSSDLPTYTKMFEEVKKRITVLKENADTAKRIMEEQKRVRDSIRRDSLAKAGVKQDSIKKDSTAVKEITKIKLNKLLNNKAKKE